MSGEAAPRRWSFGKCGMAYLTWRENRGRCVIADNDIVKGTIIRKEEPWLLEPRDAKDNAVSSASASAPTSKDQDGCWRLTEEFLKQPQCRSIEWLKKVYQPPTLFDKWNDRDELRSQVLAALYTGISAATIRRVFWIMESNALCVTAPEEALRLALFRKMSLVNHGCHPNAEMLIDKETGKLELVATRKIQGDEEITISYVPDTASLLEKRSELFNSFHFVCTCDQCLSEDYSSDSSGDSDSDSCLETH